MRLRRSLWLALTASVAVAAATITIPAYIHHLDTRAETELQAAANAIHLSGDQQNCQSLRINGADHCTMTTGNARQAVRDIPRQFRKLGLGPIHTYCARDSAKHPEHCTLLTQKRGYSLAVTAQGHLLPEPPVRFRGLEVYVSAFQSP